MFNTIRRRVGNKNHYSHFSYNGVISPLAKLCVRSISLLLIQISFQNFVKMFVTISWCVMKRNHNADFIWYRVISPSILRVLLIYTVQIWAITFELVIRFGWNYTEVFNTMRRCVANKNHNSRFSHTGVISPLAKICVRSISFLLIKMSLKTCKNVCYN